MDSVLTRLVLKSASTVVEKFENRETLVSVDFTSQTTLGQYAFTKTAQGGLVLVELTQLTFAAANPLGDVPLFMYWRDV